MGIPRGVLAAALVASCGSPQHTGKPAEPAPKVVTYAPLGIKADAKAPQQAVILGTDDRGGSTVIALPAARGCAAVDAMLTLGLVPIQLATAPNAAPNAPSNAAATAMVVATTLDKDVTDYSFSASGAVDNTSAAPLAAAGFLAAITGAPIDPIATLTGALDPDGTLGPTRELPEKLLAAIAKGKKRLGYPAGMRIATSKTGELVDVVTLAKQHGAEAIEVADVHDAYRLLTGKTLPAPLPVSEAEMALDKDTTAALDAKYKEWQTRVGTEWATLVQLESAGRLPPMLVAMRTYAKRNAETAEALHKRGLAGAAYSRMLAAWAFASATTQAYDVLQKVQAGNVAAAIDAIKAHGHLDETPTAVLGKIGAAQPTTLGEHVEMIAAFQAALRGYVFDHMATMSIEQTASYLATLQGVPTAQLSSPESADQVMQSVAPSLLYVARTIAESTLATQELDLDHAQHVPYTGSPANVLRLASSFQSASAASIEYLDSVLVQPLAAREKIADEEARVRTTQLEPDYGVAWVASRVGTGALDELKSTWGEQSLGWALLSLAGSELAYNDAAGLIAKYDSLEAHTDDTGKVDKLEHDKAFDHMLVAAERAARASAHEAKIAAGAIPVQAKLAYQLAQVERDGDLGDQLDALSEYWAATAFSQTAVMFARN